MQEDPALFGKPPHEAANKAPAWQQDLIQLIEAVDPRAIRAQRHLWLIKLGECLRDSETSRRWTMAKAAGHADAGVVRLGFLLDTLEARPREARKVAALIGASLRDLDWLSLWADFGFAPRAALWSELGERLRLKLVPSSPDTVALGELFQLMFPLPKDSAWMEHIDASMFTRIEQLLRAPSNHDTGAAGPGEALAWRTSMMQALVVLSQQIATSATSPQLRRRLHADPALAKVTASLPQAAAQLLETQDSNKPSGWLQDANYLRALLNQTRQVETVVLAHLEEHGVSANVVFQLEQLRGRVERAEHLLNVICAPSPPMEAVRLVRHLTAAAHQRRGIKALLTEHYALLARKVAERSAETGTHYITRTRAEYLSMLGRALLGGVVIAGTCVAKFLLSGWGLAPLWAGAAAGVNYASSFVIIHLLHGTVATKQPAMTAPAMAEHLRGVGESDQNLKIFVDEVVCLVRSQMAGIVGNVAAVIPTALIVMGLIQILGLPGLLTPEKAHLVLSDTSPLGATPLFAAFTGIVLFAGSLVAGWVENWFVLHGLESAMAWNPKWIATFGAERAKRMAKWWRGNVSAMSANVALGLMLGLLPVLFEFAGVPLDVRHVTLAAGQVTMALFTLGWQALTSTEALHAMMAIPVIGLLNLSVSFVLAFWLALRSRNIQVRDRRRVHRAIALRLLREPLSWLWPPKAPHPATPNP